MNITEENDKSAMKLLDNALLEFRKALEFADEKEKIKLQGVISDHEAKRFIRLAAIENNPDKQNQMLDNAVEALENAASDFEQLGDTCSSTCKGCSHLFQGLKLYRKGNGQQVKPPKFLRESEDKLTQEQKRLSRKKKGSGKRNRQKIRVAKVHRKIRNQRKDFAHKLSRNLVDTYDSIKFEDLQIKNMVQNHHLAKSINDAGWYQLMQFTKYKAEYAGKLVEFVNPAGTSQTCICGFHVPKSLSVRIHSCPSCGFIMGRDQVSAILIKNKPISTVGTTGINARQGYLSRVSMQRDAPWL